MRMAGFRPDVDEALKFLVANGCDVRPGFVGGDKVLRIPVDLTALTYAEVIELAGFSGFA
jgi:hypothetical protein